MLSQPVNDEIVWGFEGDDHKDIVLTSIRSFFKNPTFSCCCQTIRIFISQRTLSCCEAKTITV